MNLVEFIEARIADDERAAESRAFVWQERMLRECEAYRAILALGMEHRHFCGMDHRHFCDGYNGARDDAVRVLARVWRDHPDFDEEGWFDR